MFSIKKTVFVSFVYVFTLMAGQSHAGNFGVGVHGGYGIITYEEEASALGIDAESESTMNTVLFGISGEYSFRKLKNFFTAIVTDWTVGTEDRETWTFNDVQARSGDIDMSGQFYDLRFGYKNSHERIYYRMHISGGWDGLTFKRKVLVWRGIPISGNSTEEISLWRVGAGTGMGYKLGNWALDGRIAYSYHIKGRVDNSALSDVTFKTSGTCLDGGVGAAAQIADSTGFYFGISYSLFRLDESDIENSRGRPVIYPASRTQIVVGVFNLTHWF
ncbi:MAG: hypothetical protein JSW20_12910 [Nitrospiraceae bacterium]|nr:MAG: hypothetical protein JSW20_12910 [Nitrospiraceae bacterium]